MVRKPVHDDVAKRVVEMYVEQGAKLAAITEETGVPRSTIYWILQRAGVDPQRQGTRRATPADSVVAVDALKWAMERIEDLARDNGRLRAEVERLSSLVSVQTSGPAPQLPGLDG